MTKGILSSCRPGCSSQEKHSACAYEVQDFTSARPVTSALPTLEKEQLRVLWRWTWLGHRISTIMLLGKELRSEKILLFLKGAWWMAGAGTRLPASCLPSPCNQPARSGPAHSSFPAEHEVSLYYSNVTILNQRPYKPCTEQKFT